MARLAGAWISRADPGVRGPASRNSLCGRTFDDESFADGIARPSATFGVAV
jgi:hypothetical protein